MPELHRLSWHWCVHARCDCACIDSTSRYSARNEDTTRKLLKQLLAYAPLCLVPFSSGMDKSLRPMSLRPQYWWRCGRRFPCTYIQGNSRCSCPVRQIRSSNWWHYHLLVYKHTNMNLLVLLGPVLGCCCDCQRSASIGRLQ